MKSQESIIDSVKKNVILRRVFKIKDPNSSRYVKKICKIFFKKSFEDIRKTRRFKYKFTNKSGKTQTLEYVVQNLEHNFLLIKRFADEGEYTTEIKVKNNKLYYYETVKLKKVPFGFADYMSKNNFKKGFKKRIKIIRSIINE